MAAMNETIAAANETIAAANQTMTEAVAVIIAPLVNETAAEGAAGEMTNATTSEQEGMLFDKNLLIMQNEYTNFLNQTGDHNYSMLYNVNEYAGLNSKLDVSLMLANVNTSAWNMTDGS
jgi:hypothetical protein